jgi:integrase
VTGILYLSRIHRFVTSYGRKARHAFRRGLGSNLNDLGVLDLTIQKILRHSNVTTTRQSYIHHREHQVTAAMGQLAAGIEAENRRAEAERLAANPTVETIN